jgi:two-component system chemotaxis response regulator CheV
MTQNSQKRSGILLESGTNEVEFLRIAVGKGQYGINVGKVCQIMVYEEDKVSIPPHGLPGFLGLIQFRKKPIATYDLLTLLGRPASEISSTRRLLLVCEFNKKTIGYVIDTVHGIHRASWKEFCPLDQAGFSSDEQSVVGTITVDEQIVMILDLEAMMGRLDPSMGTEAFEAQIEAAESTGIDRSKLRVLYCEDSPVVQKVLLKALTKGGLNNFQVFGTGRAGLDWITTHKPEDIDIIISDIEMPGMDGLTLCREVKALPEWKDKPFIVFSSMVNDQMKERCRTVGVDVSLAKPEAHLIVETIDRLALGRR